MPNTLDPRLNGLDWTYIDRMFSHCLHFSAQSFPSSTSSSQLRLGLTGHDQLTLDAQNDVDVALKNLVGDGAADTAQRWADPGKLLEKLALIREHLEKGEHRVIDKLLGSERSTRPICGEPPSDHPEQTFDDKGNGKETIADRYYARESEEDTDFGDSDDERGKTAHKLFASLAGIDAEDKENMWCFPSPPSQAEEHDVDISPERLNAGSKRRGEPVRNGGWRLNRPTPALFSPIRASPNKSGSNVTPGQTQLDASVRKNVAAKHNKAPPATPSRSIRPSTGVTTVSTGHSLDFPICLLSSSPVAPVKGRRQSPEQTNASPDPSSIGRLALPNPGALNVTSASTSMGISGTVLKTCNHHTVNTRSSSVSRPISLVLNPNPNTSSKRKHLIDEFPPDSSKKRRRAPGPAPQPDIALRRINVVVPSSSVVSSKTSINPIPETRFPPEESFMPTERDKLRLQRMDIAQQLANTYPHLVAPSYERKRAKQLVKLRRAAAENTNHRCEVKQKLQQSQTIFSFETVDDDDGGMDWNRSRLLADDLRDAVAEGRRPVLPALRCAQSPSPCPE